MSAKKADDEVVDGPSCAQIVDGEVYVHDIDKFMERTKGAALMVTEGILWVLDDATFAWRKVDQPTPEKKARPLAAVPKPTSTT